MRRKVRAAVKRRAAAARAYVWRVAGSIRHRVVEIVRKKCKS